jgi:hypothetical protein
VPITLALRISANAPNAMILSASVIGTVFVLKTLWNAL